MAAKPMGLIEWQFIAVNLGGSRPNLQSDKMKIIIIESCFHGT